MDIRPLFNAKTAAISLWILLLILVIAVIGPGNIPTLYEKLTPDNIRSYVGSFGALAILVFLIICLIRPFFFIPITPFTIASGFLFGFGWGLLYAVIGAMLSALLVFGISRYLFQDYVKTKVLTKYPSIDQLIQSKGWQCVTFLRLLPVLPYDVVGYLAGASRIRLRDYVLGTLIGELPGAIVLVVFGASLERPGSWMFYLSLGLVVVLLIAPEVARRVLRKKSQQ